MAKNNQTAVNLPQELAEPLKQKRELQAQIEEQNAIIVRALPVLEAHEDATTKMQAVAERLEAAKGAAWAGKPGEDVKELEREHSLSTDNWKKACALAGAANTAKDAAQWEKQAAEDSLAKIDAFVRDAVRVWNVTEQMDASKICAATAVQQIIAPLAKTIALWKVNERFVGGDGGAYAAKAGRDAIGYLESFFPARATKISLWEALDAAVREEEAALVQGLEEQGVDMRHR